MNDGPGINITNAPADWLESWFRLPGEQRAVIEHHLETCRTLADTVTRLDMKDRGQHPAWKQIRVESGWAQYQLVKAVGKPNAAMLSQYENGKTIPRTGPPSDRYKAILTNLATDQYHHHLTKLAWHLCWSERQEMAPEIVTADESFLTWTTQQDDHPVLTALAHSLTYDPTIEWPLKISAA